MRRGCSPDEKASPPDSGLGFYTFCQKPRQLGKNKIVMQMAESCDALQFSVCLVERNNALDIAAGVEYANLARAKTRALLCVIDGLIFLGEYRLNAGRFKNLPAPTVWPDFDDCHTTTNPFRLSRCQFI